MSTHYEIVTLGITFTSKLFQDTRLQVSPQQRSEKSTSNVTNLCISRAGQEECLFIPNEGKVQSQSFCLILIKYLHRSFSAVLPVVFVPLDLLKAWLLAFCKKGKDMKIIQDEASKGNQQQR